MHVSATADSRSITAFSRLSTSSVGSPYVALVDRDGPRRVPEREQQRLAGVVDLDHFRTVSGGVEAFGQGFALAASVLALCGERDRLGDAIVGREPRERCQVAFGVEALGNAGLVSHRLANGAGEQVDRSLAAGGGGGEGPRERGIADVLGYRHPGGGRFGFEHPPEVGAEPDRGGLHRRAPRSAHPGILVICIPYETCVFGDRADNRARLWKTHDPNDDVAAYLYWSISGRLCPVCGDVIGVYEPLVVIGRLARVSSLAREPLLGSGDEVIVHRACGGDPGATGGEASARTEPGPLAA